MTFALPSNSILLLWLKVLKIRVSLNKIFYISAKTIKFAKPFQPVHMGPRKILLSTVPLNLIVTEPCGGHAVILSMLSLLCTVGFVYCFVCTGAMPRLRCSDGQPNTGPRQNWPWHQGLITSFKGGFESLFDPDSASTYKIIQVTILSRSIFHIKRKDRRQYNSYLLLISE